MTPLEYLTALHGDEPFGNLMLAFKPAKGKGFRDEPLDVRHIERALPVIERWHDTHESYAAIALFAGERRWQEMIGHSRWLGLDRDDLPLSPLLPSPTLTMRTSPGRYQDLFRLDAPVDWRTAGQLMVRIADVNGNGHQAVDPGHLFRLPGLANHKRGGMRVEVTEYDSGALYAPRDFLSLPSAKERPKQPLDAVQGQQDGTYLWQTVRPHLSPRMVACADGANCRPDGRPYDSESEADEALFVALINAGLDDAGVYAALFATRRGAMMIERHGKDSDRRAWRGIRGAREYLASTAGDNRILGPVRSHIRVDCELMGALGRDLGPDGHAVYCALLKHAGRVRTCFPSQELIAEQWGVSRKTVGKEIRKLAALGLIEIGKMPGRRSNLYTINDPAEVCKRMKRRG